ncbi:MAG: Cof-type HAD-IIB family hydrolase [Clostridia bacterium]
MYKLVAIDLDGTLLNSYGEISDRNKNAIKIATEKGAKIVIASGRPIQSAKSFANEAGASNYIISGNGSVLYDAQDNKILYSKAIDRQKALEIIKICEENSIFYCVYTDNLIISKSLNYNILFFNNDNKKMPEDKQTNIKIMDNIYKYIEENPNVEILKITICDEDKIIFGGIIRKLREIKEIDVLDVEHMARKVITTGTEEIKVEYHYTEITSKDVNKWNAIKKLADLLQIKQEEIMAIGDNMNDKEMIENAGLGVIMGNSAPYMKEFANIVAESNNEDGVAQVLEEYIIKSN